MPKRPDWSINDPSTIDVQSWVPTPTVENPGAGYTTSSHSSSPYIGNRAVRSYAVTPGINSKSRPTLVAPLPYSAMYEVWSAEYQQSQKEWRYFGSSRYAYQDDAIFTHNQFPAGFLPPEPYDWDAQNWKALNDLLSKVKDQKINMAQAFAERERTVKTVTDTAQTIAKALHNLGRGNIAGAARALGVGVGKRSTRRFNKEFANDVSNAMSNGWLALQYGWKPLLQDVHGAAEALSQAVNGSVGGNTMFLRVSGQSRKDLSKSSLKENPHDGMSGSDTTLFETNASVNFKYGVVYSISSPQVHNLASLGITNPAALAWELVPYSFVVDWFVPIGDWLSSLDATLGLSFVSGYRTITTRTYQQSVTTQFLTSTAPERVWMKNGREHHHLVQVDRITLSDAQVSPILHPPMVKNPLSSSHLASAMALLKQFKR